MSSPSGVIGYARFRSTPEVLARYPLHISGRWYPVLSREAKGSGELMPAGGMLWLDLGLVRGVPASDVEFREGGVPPG